MITFSLQSGSCGNSTYVEAGGMRLLFDAGISGRDAEERLRARGREIRSCHGLFVSHDHDDHVRCAGVWHRKFGLPLYITPGALAAARARGGGPRPAGEARGGDPRSTGEARHGGPRPEAQGLGLLDDVRHFRPGDQVEVGPVKVHALRTPHDAADAVAFVVEHAGKRVGILIDLGHPFRELAETLPGLDGAYLESNYDPRMLETGSYPPALKARIRGGRGHLSNMQSALLARGAIGSRLRWIAIAHLSEENNRPELALEEHRRQVGGSFPIHHAPRHGPGPVLEV